MNATPCIQDLPLAAPGLTSYRYKGPMSWVMIGATCDSDALRQAQRSVAVPVELPNLQVWNGMAYTPAS